MMALLKNYSRKQVNKGNRGKARKKISKLRDPNDEKYAQGAVITFQKEQEDDEQYEKLPEISRGSNNINIDEEEDAQINAYDKEDRSELQETQNKKRMDALHSAEKKKRVKSGKSRRRKKVKK